MLPLYGADDTLLDSPVQRREEKKERHEEYRELEHVSKHAYDHLSEAREDDI